MAQAVLLNLLKNIQIVAVLTLAFLARYAYCETRLDQAIDQGWNLEITTYSAGYKPYLFKSVLTIEKDGKVIEGKESLTSGAEDLETSLCKVVARYQNLKRSLYGEDWRRANSVLLTGMTSEDFEKTQDLLMTESQLGLITIGKSTEGVQLKTYSSDGKTPLKTYVGKTFVDVLSSALNFKLSSTSADPETEISESKLISLEGKGNPKSESPNLEPKSTPSFEQEFRNYFSTKETGIEPKEIGRAIGSVVKRLQIPHLRNGKIRVSPLLKDLSDEMKTMGIKGNLAFGGRTVQTLLAYLYKEIHRQKDRKHPKTTLNQIIESKAPLYSIDVLGVNYLLELVVESESSEDTQAATQLLTEFKGTQLGDSKPKVLIPVLQELIFPQLSLVDSKIYSENIREGGGNELNQLTFNIIKETFVGSHRHENILNRFFQEGIVDYIPAGKPPSEIDQDSKAVTGLIPLELFPFLKYSPEGQERLEAELEGLYKKVQTCSSRKAVEAAFSNCSTREAIQKLRSSSLVRSNRFYREPNSPISSWVLRIGAIPKEYELEVVDNQRDFGGTYEMVPDKPRVVLNPEFLDHIDPTSRVIRPIDPDLLTPPKDIKDHHSKEPGSILFHGTNSVGNIFSIIRNGPMMNTIYFGAASYGRAWYASTEYGNSVSHCFGNGLVLILKVKENMPVRILDWKKHENDPRILKIRKEARKAKRDVFEYLAHEYGIDILVRRWIQVFNTGVLDFPATVGELIQQQKCDHELYQKGLKEFSVNPFNQEIAERLRGIYKDLKDVGEWVGASAEVPCTRNCKSH